MSTNRWYKHFFRLCDQNDVIVGDSLTTAQQTQVLTRQLEYVKSKTYDIEYSELKAFNFIPLATDTPEDAETIVYRQWNLFGEAKLVANYADDLPLADVNVTEFPTPVFSIGAAYQWSVLDLRRAARGEVNLQARKAQSARHMIDRKIDNVLVFGIPAAGTEGFANNSNVPVVVVTNGNWLGGATSTEILEDLFELEQAVITQTLDIHEPDTLVLPSDLYGHVKTTPLFPGQSDSTILSFFLANSQSVKNVEKWNVLGNVGGVPRAVCYKLSPEILEAEVPLLLDELPPQERNLAFVVPMWARVGSTVWYRPLGAVYGEGM